MPRTRTLTTSRCSPLFLVAVACPPPRSRRVRVRSSTPTRCRTTAAAAVTPAEAVRAAVVRAAAGRPAGPAPAAEAAAQTQPSTRRPRSRPRRRPARPAAPTAARCRARASRCCSRRRHRHRPVRAAARGSGGGPGRDAAPSNDRAVLFVSYSGLFGGSERVLLDVATGLGGEPVVVCPDGPLAERARAAGIRTFTVPQAPARAAGDGARPPGHAAAAGRAGLRGARARALAAARRGVRLGHARGDRVRRPACAASRIRAHARLPEQRHGPGTGDRIAGALGGRAPRT